MQRVMVLHLSDLHLAGTYRPYYEFADKLLEKVSVCDRFAVDALLETVDLYTNHIDAVLISGDIVVAGTRSDLTYANSMFTPSLMPTLFQAYTLGDFPKPIVILPGNHDRFCNIGGYPGNLFYTCFSNYWPSGVGGIHTVFIPTQSSSVLCIISCDFSLQHVADCDVQYGHWGQGRVYVNRLNSLIQETQKVQASNPNCGIIWMVHFAPDFENHRELSRNMVLIDSGLLIKQAEKLGVNYIFCGHTHEMLSYKVGNKEKVWVHCAGSSTCISGNRTPTIHLRDIYVANGAVVQIRSRTLNYDPTEQIFRA